MSNAAPYGSPMEEQVVPSPIAVLPEPVFDSSDSFNIRVMLDILRTMEFETFVASSSKLSDTYSTLGLSQQELIMGYMVGETHARGGSAVSVELQMLFVEVVEMVDALSPDAVEVASTLFKEGYFGCFKELCCTAVNLSK